MIRTEPNNLNIGIAGAAIALALIVLSPLWLQDLLTAKGFIPHGHCYLWKTGLVWLHVSSDSLIALAYVAISATLAYLVYKTQQEIPFHWMFLAFGTFIVACGSTHFMEVWTLWHPTYWLSGGLKLITAIASVTTAIALPPLVPKALALVEAAKLSEERRLHLETANSELQMLYGKLKEVDSLKTQFFANVSHELRTPLALILAPTQQLLTMEELTQDQQRYLSVIERNARMLLKQVNELLDVSKVEEGKMQVNYSEIDLAQLLHLSATSFDALVRERQISFTVETPDSVPAQIDVEKLQHVLLNLLSNAFKFTPNGGSIRCVLSVEQHQPIATISVQDSGPGVPPELREAIFERFRQLEVRPRTAHALPLQGEAEATRSIGGTGLGLAIVKELIELQAGTVTVDDAPGGGACFTVELPLTAPANVKVSNTTIEVGDLQQTALPVLAELLNYSTRVPSTQTSAASNFSCDWESAQMQGLEKPLVLVVEDNPELNSFIAETLASEYRITRAENGQDGLEIAIALQPDLILSDIMMPQMSGDRLVHQIRTHPQLDTTPIILLTAKTDDALRVQLLRSGVQDYLIKPFFVEELRARVSNQIAIKRTRDLLQQELASQSEDLEGLAQEVMLRRRELQIALNGLQQQADELMQANRLKDEFLAVISHELRTPLNVILGWAQALRARRFNEVTTFKALETIERNAKLQIQLIENLLDISRLLRGKLLLNMRPVDLQSVIQTAIQNLQPAAEAKSIQMESVLNSSVEAVSGDPDRLQQIVENLLDNAIKFTPNGGQVKVELDYPDSEARIQISDTGQGISVEALPHIFDYFRQADSSITRKHGGLGLGLALVRQLVELQNGTVKAESLGEGQGASFTINLPLMNTPTLPRYLS